MTTEYLNEITEGVILRIVVKPNSKTQEITLDSERKYLKIDGKLYSELRILRMEIFRLLLQEES